MIAHLWVSISYPLTHTVYLLKLSYLAGSKSVSIHPCDPEAMTITTLEGVASASSKKKQAWHLQNMKNRNGNAYNLVSVGEMLCHTNPKKIMGAILLIDKRR